MKAITENIRAAASFKEIPVERFAPSGSWAEAIAEKLKNDMKTTQLRKVFTSIKSMEQKTKGKNGDDPFDDPAIFMLVPHLAYAKGRKLITGDFYDLIKTIIGDGKSGKIKTVNDFRRFVDFMTAIVAYHKQYRK